jgi:hypothetical protein
MRMSARFLPLLPTSRGGGDAADSVGRRCAWDETSRQLRALCRQTLAFIGAVSWQRAPCFTALPYATPESSGVRAAATADPRAFLARFSRCALVDQVQRAPELLSRLPEVIDAAPGVVRFVLTGSSDFARLQSVSRSLAGCVGLARQLPLPMPKTGRAMAGPSATHRPVVIWGGSDSGPRFGAYALAWNRIDHLPQTLR